eukprot:COSAG01_NODE_63991_length_278_cov_0.575419_1_plen_26_part_01
MNDDMAHTLLPGYRRDCRIPWILSFD